MAAAAPQVLLCPRCKIPMVRAAGFSGLWVCPFRSDHEFAEDSSQNSRGTVPPKNFTVIKEVGAGEKNQPPPRCPQCRTVAKRDEIGHWFCDSPAHSKPYVLPLEDEPYWLSHLGITGPISQVPQSNARPDSSIMNGPPEFGKGGGGSSGRKRKKPPKKSDFQPWYQV